MADRSGPNPFSAEGAQVEGVTDSDRAPFSSIETRLQLASSLASTPISDWLMGLTEYAAKSQNADLSTLWDIITSYNVDVDFCLNSIMESLPRAKQLLHVQSIVNLVSVRKEQYEELLVPAYDWYMSNRLYEDLATGTEEIGSSWHGVTTKTVDGLKATVARSRRVHDERVRVLKAIQSNWNRDFYNAVPIKYHSGRCGLTFLQKFRRFTNLCTTYEQAWGSEDQPGILPPIIDARLNQDFNVRSKGVTHTDLVTACDLLSEEQVDDEEGTEDTRVLRDNVDPVNYGGMTSSSSKRSTSKRSKSKRSSLKSAARSKASSTKASRSSKGHNDEADVTGINEAEDTNNIDASTRVSNNENRSSGSNTGSEPSAQHSAEQADGPPTDLSASGQANNVGDSGSSNTRPDTGHASRVVEGNVKPSGRPQTTPGVRPLSSGLTSGQDNPQPPRQENRAGPSHPSLRAHQTRNSARQSQQDVPASSAAIIRKRKAPPSLEELPEELANDDYTSVYARGPELECLGWPVYINKYSWLRDYEGINPKDGLPKRHRFGCLDWVISMKDMVIGLKNEIDGYTRILNSKYSIATDDDKHIEVQNMCYTIFQQMIRQDPCLYYTVVCMHERKDPTESWKMLSYPWSPRVEKVDSALKMSNFREPGLYLGDYSRSLQQATFSFTVPEYAECWTFPLDFLVLGGSRKRTPAVDDKDLLQSLERNHHTRTLPAINPRTHKGANDEVMNRPFAPIQHFPNCSAIGNALTGATSWEDSTVIEELQRLFSSNQQVRDEYVSEVRKNMSQNYVDCYRRFVKSYFQHWRYELEDLPVDD